MTQTGPTPEEIAADHARRVAMTISCRDTDRLPKVEGAGEVLTLDDGSRVQRMHNGLLVLEGGYLGTWTTEIITGLQGHHEPQEEVAFADVLERVAEQEDEPVIVELGCYWSYYSMWFQQRTGGRSVGMEPDPAYLEVGRRNMAINGMDATFVTGAIGGEAGTEASFEAESTGETVTVPVYTLESLMDETGVARASVVLADIQGFERDLLDSIDGLVRAGRIRFMVISTHHRMISGRATTHQEALARIDELGGHVLAEHTVGESYSGDGLVVVSFDDRDRGATIDMSHARYKESYFGEVEPDLQRVLDELEATREHQRATEDLSRQRHALIEDLQVRLAAAEAELDRTSEQLAARERGLVGRVAQRLRSR
ncbi:FkbM family methyltransferase [Cellulomonas hominis]|uniref:FkbM family methyltransferase n=1 Tax=Cellulomonas hominis TaxID=156981 RepID=UPI001C109FAB|nr:FkbM family methyltransferase [Cellulomonas hominis]MBU5424025.1 FkbM family methyltransferase [Cellulomonas hominis]